MISNGKILWSADPDFTVFAQKGIFFRYFLGKFRISKTMYLNATKKHDLGQLFKNNVGATRQVSTLRGERSTQAPSNPA
jgi:hypothetical protein